MSETDLASTILATPLAALLEAAARPQELGAYRLSAYRGVLTPNELDVPARETAALASEAAIHDLGWLKRVAVRGEDRFRWLSGMVTNTVNDLFPNSGAWNLVLNAQGRIQGDLTVWRGGEELEPQRRNPAGDAPGYRDPLLGTPFAGESGLELEIAADQFDKLMAHLNRFIIMDDVELVPTGEDQAGEAGPATAIGLTGPWADEVMERLSLPVFAHPMMATRVEWNGLNLRIERGYGVLAKHYAIWVQPSGVAKLWKYLLAAGATPVGSERVEAFRIAEGIPAYGIDIAERDLPQETAQTRALHFNKGCYLGQEIVERIRSRGSVHRHLRALELTGPIPFAGTELSWEGGVPAGQITSVAELPLASGRRVFALGMIRDGAEPGIKELIYSSEDGAGKARILDGPPVLGGGPRD
ncbi:MAG: folate-binding protein [Terracidiphilus sp.]|jgi:folate-binding protein YgfZ